MRRYQTPCVADQVVSPKVSLEDAVVAAVQPEHAPCGVPHSRMARSRRRTSAS